MFADVHAHLDLFKPDEIPQIIQRAKDAGVKAIINNGVDGKTNKATLELAEKYPIIKAAIGLYPVDALKLTESEIGQQLVFIEKNSKKIVAMGEIGLDYLKAEEKERQKDIFMKQVELARKLDKGVIVHSRKAESDVVRLLSDFGAKKVVMHCCMANLKIVKKAIDAGFHFSIPALLPVSSHFQAVANAVPLSLLLTETDAPFLSPVKGKQSEPAMVRETVNVIAKIKGITEEECANILFSNYQRVFS